MTNLITADFNGTAILFENDGYLNSTGIAKSFGKIVKDYLRNDRTKEYIQALDSVRRNILTEKKQWVIVKRGGNPHEQGTWLHPKLAIDFARWLSPDERWSQVRVRKSDIAQT